MISTVTASSNARKARRTGWEDMAIEDVKANAEGCFQIVTEKGNLRRYPVGSARRHVMIQEGIDACRALIQDRTEELRTWEIDRYLDMWQKLSAMIAKNLAAQVKERKINAAEYGVAFGRDEVTR